MNSFVASVMLVQTASAGFVECAAMEAELTWHSAEFALLAFHSSVKNHVYVFGRIIGSWREHAVLSGVAILTGVAFCA